MESVSAMVKRGKTITEDGKSLWDVACFEKLQVPLLVDKEADGLCVRE